MNAVLCSAQALARRTIPKCAPRGTPSRIHKLRLERAVHRSAKAESSAAPSPLVEPEIDPVSIPLDARLQKHHVKLKADELDFLHQVLTTPLQNTSPEPSHPRNATLPQAPLSNTASFDKRLAGNDGDLREAGHAGQSVAEEGTASAPSRMISALRDPMGTPIFLRQLISSAMRKADLEDPHALAQLPATAFSELLRSLDPLEIISKEVDPTAGIRVGPGMAHRTPLGNSIDIYGVRKSYLLLFRRLLAAVQLRTDAGRHLLLSDYKILLRAAGASSDPESARLVWDMMEKHSQESLRNTDVFSEFLKARYLADPLYVQYDTTRLRVRPINLWKSKRKLDPQTRWRLRNLRRRILLSETLRHGQNRHKPDIVEDLTRILRKKKPSSRVYQTVLEEKYAPDESLLGAVLIALARSGSLDAMQDLLSQYYQLKVTRMRSTGDVVISMDTKKPVPAPDSPLYPTEQLLDAVVEAFCSNAELQTAVKLIDYISRRFSVSVPPRVWSRLLEWSYIMCLYGFRTEWAAIGLPQKATHPDAVKTIWDVMTAAPYNVQPGLQDYGFLIKSLIVLGKREEAMGYMLELQPHYKHLLHDLEESFYRDTALHRLNVDRPKIRKEFLDAQTHKEEAWYYFQLWLHLLLKKGCPKDANDDMAVRMIPQLIDAFRPVLPEQIKYRISTGIIEIKRIQAISRFRPVAGSLPRPAWVSGDIVGQLRKDWAGKGGHDSEAKPLLTFEERLHKRPEVTLRKAIRAQIDPDTFVERPLSLGTLQRQFT